MSTTHHRGDERFAEILAEDHPGIPLPVIEAAKHLAESLREVPSRGSRDRCDRSEGYGTRPTVTQSLRPTADIAAGLRGMAS